LKCGAALVKMEVQKRSVGGRKEWVAKKKRVPTILHKRGGTETEGKWRTHQATSVSHKKKSQGETMHTTAHGQKKKIKGRGVPQFEFKCGGTPRRTRKKK